VGVGESAQAGGGGFGGEVALGHAEHFEADHEFANLCGAEERRVKVGVEVHRIVRLTVCGALVESHGVGEADLEEVVVAGGDGLEDGGEGTTFGGGEVGEAAEMATGKDEGLERPGGPVGDDRDEEIVLDDDASFRVRKFGGDVIAEKAGVVLVVIGLLGGKFAERLVGDVLGGPDLAVWVRVGGSHHGTAVFEDLDVVDPGEVAERGGFVGPGVDDAGDVGDGHAGEGEGVVGVEAEDAAEAALGFGDEERGGVGSGVGLDLREEGREIIVEGEDAGVGGIVDTAGADVGGAEVALGIVGEAGRGDGLGGFALPGALGALGGDEDPLAEKRIVATMGDEIEGAGCGGHRESSLGWRSDGYKCMRELEGGASSRIHPTHRDRTAINVAPVTLVGERE
jgi:hypothetical protein